MIMRAVHCIFDVNQKKLNARFSVTVNRCGLVSRTLRAVPSRGGYFEEYSTKEGGFLRRAGWNEKCRMSFRVVEGFNRDALVFEYGELLWIFEDTGKQATLCRYKPLS